MARRRSLDGPAAQINITVRAHAAGEAEALADEYGETRSEVWRQALGDPFRALDRARKALARRARMEAREEGR